MSAARLYADEQRRFRLKLAGAKPARMKKEAMRLYEDMVLTKMASAVKKWEETSMPIFIAKIHTEECPFRAIVGSFLYRATFDLQLDDQYLIHKPQSGQLSSGSLLPWCEWPFDKCESLVLVASTKFGVRESYLTDMA